MRDDWEERAFQLPRGDAAALIEHVRAELEHGDITTSFVHHLAMVSGVRHAAEIVERERLRWFHERGLAAPEMQGPPGLE
jgi:aminoglycoside phosphotransferase